MNPSLFTPEIIFTIMSIVFGAGSLYTLFKLVENKTKEHAKDLQAMVEKQHDIITQQSIHQEKINKISETLNKLEFQIEQKISKIEDTNIEILKIVSRERI